jgi:ceramide glucosyltransferase
MTFVLTLLTIITAAGVAITTLQTIFTALFRRKRDPFVFPQAASFTSILKPVCGLDDELEQNLESFAHLRGIDFELIISVADVGDAALDVVERFCRAHPDLDVRVVIGGDPSLENGNRKVARLIAAQREARGEILFISDSNVRVEPDDLAKTIAAFGDARVGCVSNLFTGSRAATLGARIESLHLLSFVVTGNVLAAAGNVPCVVGKSMAISRRALDAIGGFEAFANVLAEDQAIALAVRDAGFRVTLSPVVVRNVVVNRTVKRALDRQIRWNKIRYSFSSGLYSAEFLVNPLPFAIFTGSLELALAVVLLRMAQIAILGWSTAANLTWREIALTPLLDLLQFGAQFVPYLDESVTWRGYRVRLGPNTQLLAPAAHEIYMAS